MLLLYSISGAQVVTTEGTDFWVGFLRNYSGAGGELNLMASGRYATYVRVANASGSWTASYNTTPGQVLTIPIPGMFQPGIDSDLEVVRDYGLHVTSGAPISLYASNYISASYDNTNILPTSSLRSNYIIQSASTITHPRNGNEFCVVATEILYFYSRDRRILSRQSRIYREQEYGQIDASLWLFLWVVYVYLFQVDVVAVTISMRRRYLQNTGVVISESLHPGHAHLTD